jgi:CBS domain containing-hemolysin-like protein
VEVVLLVFYVALALSVSFLCSIAEAVLLSVSDGYIRLLEDNRRRAGPVLRGLVADIDRPLAAILTLNTIAHTMGAAGAGAQAAVVFGSAAVGLFSAVLTLLILVLSEIIPKTLGAHHWRRLAPATAYGVSGLIVLLKPFVHLSRALTRWLTGGRHRQGLSRGEFAALAETIARDGHLSAHELDVVRNVVRLRDRSVRELMTPRTIVFSLPEGMRVETFFHKHDSERFSRIPIYRGDPDQVVGFVLRSDLLLAYGRGNHDRALSHYRRDLRAVPEGLSALHAMEQAIATRCQMLLVVDEYGSTQGIVTLEDLMESVLGHPIVDEGDIAVDLRHEARRRGRRRLRDRVAPGRFLRSPDTRG